MLAKAFLALVASLTFMAPLPPVDYRQNNISIVKFVDDANTKENCGVAPKGRNVACAGVNNSWIILPNPCQFPEDNYARIACHELGHNNGWPADHPNPDYNMSPQTSPQTNPKK